MKNEMNLKERYGKLASILGIVLNVFLAVGKIVVGALCGAISVLADGFNNLSDCGSSVISLVSFKLSAKPADEEHPFGHERIEYISSMAVAFLILIIAFELVKESIAGIISPSASEFSYVIVGVLAVSIIIKGGMFIYNNALAKRFNSEMLKATAADCISDCVSTTAVLVALIVSKFTGVNLDGYCGILVALFIAWSGVGILKETMSRLVGQAPDKELVESIKQRILSHEGVIGVHDLSVYSYGPDKYFASVHIEVSAEVDVLKSHELIDVIEQEFITQTDIVLTGHLDPIVVNDEEVNSLRERITKIVSEENPEYSTHDFRMVKGQNSTNLIFDVAVPFNVKSVESVKQDLKRIITDKIGNEYNLVITVEKQIKI